MRVLPYGIVDGEEAVAISAIGVAGSAVDSLLEGELRAFYSRLAELAPGAPSVRSQALEFHAVIRDIFRQVAVVPFRFPTLLESEEELKQHLRAQQGKYREFLERTRGLVQMEARLAMAERAAKPGSGREYLVRRQQAARALEAEAARIADAVHGLVQEWKKRSQGEGLRCYALVPRSAIEEFRRRVGKLSGPGHVKMTVSGPWPATEFLDAAIQS